MLESEFTTKFEHTLESLELALDEVDTDIDYENSGGVLTVEFDEAEADWRCTRSGVLFRPFVVEQMRSEGDVVLELG